MTTQNQLEIYYLVSLFIIAWILLYAWNAWFVVPIFHISMINYWQALLLAWLIHKKPYWYVVKLKEE